MKNQQEKAPKGCIIAIVIAVICLIAYCNRTTDDDIKSQKALAYADSIKLIVKKQSDSLTKVPVETDMKNTYKDLLENNDMPAIYIEDFARLLTKAKGSKFQSKIKKTYDSLKYVVNLNDAKHESTTRKASEENIRNTFLDNNLNIKVSVSGKNNTRLKLTYVLFNDVWFRKFETQGYFDTFAKKGFKKIILSDGYDYEKWMEYK